MEGIVKDCHYIGVVMDNSLEVTTQLLEKQNDCLMSNNQLLVTALKEQEIKEQKLNNQFVQLQSHTNEFINTYQREFKQTIDTRDHLYKASIDSAGNCLFVLSIVVGLFASFGLAAVFKSHKDHKEREISKIFASVRKELTTKSELRDDLFGSIKKDLRRQVDDMLVKEFEKAKPVMESMVEECFDRAKNQERQNPLDDVFE